MLETGRIPTELGNLEALTHLGLTHNNLEGERLLCASRFGVPCLCGYNCLVVQLYARTERYLGQRGAPERDALV